MLVSDSFNYRALLLINTLITFGSTARQSSLNPTLCNVPVIRYVFPTVNMTGAEIADPESVITNAFGLSGNPHYSSKAGSEEFTLSPDAFITEKNYNSHEHIIDDTEKNTFRVVGGKPVRHGEIPYFAKLIMNSKDKRPKLHLCAGSIIAKRWILSSAACLLPSENGYAEVGFGNVLGTRQYEIENLIPHHLYKATDPFPYNIGLVHLKEDIRFRINNIYPVKLPRYNFNMFEYPVAIVGFVYKELMAHKQHVKNITYVCSKIMDIETCRVESGFENLTKTQICFYNAPGQRFCDGDWGGPVVADGVQIGINSYIRTACSEPQPDGYTRVWTFIEWIEDHIGAPHSSGTPNRAKIKGPCQLL